MRSGLKQAACVGALAAGTATAGAPGRDMISDLMLWIEGHSALDAAPMPHLAILSDVKRWDWPGDLPAKVVALYETETGTIHLAENWSDARLYDQSVLLHELVHHLQVANGIAQDCPARLNALAYRLQTDWLRAKGIGDPQEYLGLTDAAIFARSACPDPWGALEGDWTVSGD